MKQRQQALRLTVYLEQTDTHQSTPIYAELVARARAAGLAGATVIRATEGFGAQARTHALHGPSITLNVPVVVTIMDTPDKLQALAHGTAPVHRWPNPARQVASARSRAASVAWSRRSWSAASCNSLE